MNLVEPTRAEIEEADRLARKASWAMDGAPIQVAMLAAGQVFASIAINAGVELPGFIITATSIFNACSLARAHKNEQKTREGML
jgi:hypothetical protein